MASLFWYLTWRNFSSAYILHYSRYFFEVKPYFWFLFGRGIHPNLVSNGLVRFQIYRNPFGYHFRGNGAEGDKVRCSLCKRPYHLRCAFLDRPPESVQCYCHQREDTLSRLDFKCAFSFLPRSIMLSEKISQAVESVKASPMDGSGFY